MDGSAVELLNVFFAIPGVFMMLIFLGAASVYVLLSAKNVISGGVLTLSGAAYLATGLWILFSYASTSVHMLSFVLIVFAIGQLAFGIDLLLAFWKKNKQRKPL
ncbi:MAG: hypothetical protein ABIH90_00565 [Candidatus Aenigmatarchaeota archaeon]